MPRAYFDPEGNILKQCTTCLQVKTDLDFTLDDWTSDGLRPRCKKCERQKRHTPIKAAIQARRHQRTRRTKADQDLLDRIDSHLEEGDLDIQPDPNPQDAGATDIPPTDKNNQ